MSARRDVTDGESVDVMSLARTSRFGLLALLLLATTGLAACEEERPEPTDPEGAFRLFQEALGAGDEDGIWEYLDKGTKELFVDQYRALVRIDRIIEAYFDPSEHRYMRKRTGAYLLQKENLKTPKDLYAFVLDGSSIVFERDQEVGADVEELAYSDEAETIAQISTKGGQTFIFVKEEDKIWRTPSLRKLFETALVPISNSEAAMKEFAKENLMDERQRRLEVIEFATTRAAEKNAPPPAEAMPTPGAPSDEAGTAPAETAPEAAPADSEAPAEPTEDAP